MNLAELVGTYVLDGWGSFHIAWSVRDIRIGGRSQFNPGSDIPGDMFAATSMDPALNLDPVGARMDLSVEVVNTGDHTAMFIASCIGAGSAGSGRMVMPLSGGPVQPGATAVITARPTSAFRPQRLMIARPNVTHLYLRLDGVVYDFTGGPRDGAEVSVATAKDVNIENILEPRVLTFYAREVPNALSIVWAVDDASSSVVFEAGAVIKEVVWSSSNEDGEDGDDDDDDDLMFEGALPYFEPRPAPSPVSQRVPMLRFDAAGFVPEWLAMIETEGALGMREPAPAKLTVAETKGRQRKDAMKDWK